MRAEQLQTLEYKLGTEQTRYELLLHENTQTITSLKIENDSLQGRIRELEAKLSAQAKESRYELDGLQTKYNALEARVSSKTYDYSDEITKLKETVKLKNEQIATLELKNTTEQKLFEQIMKDNQSRINSLVAEREELTRELEERKILFNNELKLANQMSDASIEQMQNSLRSQISAYQQQVAELKAELENKENVIYRIKRQNKQLEMYKEIPTPLTKMDYSETRKNSFYDKRASPTTFDDMRTHTRKEASPYERNVRRPSVNSSGWRCKIQQVKSTLDDHFMNFSRYD
jgi:chromosome segregation ATPase